MTKKQPYWMMPLWKFMLLSAFCGTVIFIVLWSLGFRSTHSLGIFTAKHALTLPQERVLADAPPLGLTPSWLYATTYNGHTSLKQVPRDDKITHLPNRNMTADVGQYGTAAAAKLELPKLKKYLNDCASTEDCCVGLADRVAVRDVPWVSGEDKYIYILVIEHLDDPTFYALCDYMWNGDRQWARETYHRCSDFNQWGSDP